MRLPDFMALFLSPACSRHQVGLTVPHDFRLILRRKVAQRITFGWLGQNLGQGRLPKCFFHHRQGIVHPLMQRAQTDAVGRPSPSGHSRIRPIGSTALTTSRIVKSDGDFVRSMPPPDATLRLHDVGMAQAL